MVMTCFSDCVRESSFKRPGRDAATGDFVTR